MSLLPSEVKILKLMMTATDRKEICESLGIKNTTLRRALYTIRKRTGLNNNQLIVEFLKQGGFDA